MKLNNLLLAVSCIFVSFTFSACGSAQGKLAQKDSSRNAASGTLGVNVNSIQWGDRVFKNLIYGSSWMAQDGSGRYSEVPADELDPNGWVKSLPTGIRATRTLSVPMGAGKYICRYQGNGILAIAGSAVSNVSSSAGSIRFTLSGTYPNAQAAILSYKVDPTDYIRNIDCREINSATTETLTPEFLSVLSLFRVIRFMKWQPATEGNWPVSWGRRNKPGDGDYTKNDGVPVEVIVQTANQAGADLWVTIPWNADSDYITKFATYVRNNLASSHSVYVEVSNEVWNGSYPVSAQAAKEAQAEGLRSGTNSATAGNLERYAEKTKQVMAIWRGVFSGQPSRLVRVASWQHVSPYYTDLLLKYMSLSGSVDALATAPYFGFEATDSMSVDQIMSALPGEVNTAVNWGVQQKSVASKYGLRYLTYEAGQSIVLSKNVVLEQQVERDARMHDAYRLFLSSWQSQVGGALTLFALEGQISQYGAWGLSEFVGQPSSEAPKLQAVLEFLRANTKSMGPSVANPPKKVCAGGTIIPSRSTCRSK